MAAETRHDCPRCMGSGKFTAQVVNGRPVGPGGDCYRCDGKGWQSDADRRRNAYYDARVAPYRAS